MVKKKSGRTLNPADAHRKAIRQKEIKKNKVERKRVRTLVMVHKDTSKLEEEITRYRTLDKEKWLDKNGKVKLKELEEKFSKIVETKKAHGVSVTKDKPKDHTATVFYHPTLNPSGLPPTTDAGSLQSKSTEDSTTDDEGSLTDSDESTDYLSDHDENSEEIDNTDIPLPPGSPPKKTNETSDNDDDKLPELPPGPPPSKKQFEIISPLNNQRQNMRLPPNSFLTGTGPNHFGRLPPPPPPIHGQVFASHSHNTPVSRPPPFSTKFLHYVIQAEPQVRNLQKELTTLIPATLLRKKAVSNKPKVIRPLVNTAPNIDDGLVTEITSSSSTSSFTIPTKRPSSPSVIAVNIPLLQNQTSNDKQQQ
ncbi:7269_t:CDS:2, partial [Entrophospora sp. SA101]